MSTTIATLAGTTGSGLGTSRHIIFGINDNQYWAFGLTSTNVLSSWSSPDGLTWTAGATHTLSHTHNSDGRNLTIGYQSINSIDTVLIYYNYVSANVVWPVAVRATIQSGVIAYHSTDTDLTITTGVDSGALYWLGGSIEIDPTNHWIIGSSRVNNSGTYNYDNNARRSSADPGTAESATPVTWTGYDIDNSDATESRSAYVVDTGSGTMGLLSDNGASSAGTTGISWYTWSGSSWSGTADNRLATGTISSIDKNDWGSVRVDPNDVHVVYRSGGSSFVHRRWNGSTWSNGDPIPAQASKAGGGIALGTDGVNVWLVVIDSDSANTIRTCIWDPAFNGWQSWLEVESSVATRTFVGVQRDLVANTLLPYWTEGSDFVTVAFPTFADPPGPSTRNAVSHQPVNLAASSATLTITFDGVQPTPGDKVACMFWAAGFSGTPTITSVKDNATDVGGGHTFTAGPLRVVGSTQGIWSAWLDLPISAVWTGNYTLTVTMSVSCTELDGGAISYGGVVSGAPTATNNNAGTGTAATGGAVNPSTGLSTYLVGLTCSSATNPSTITYPGVFTRQIAQLDGSTQQVGAIGDAINQVGSQNPSVTITTSNWLAVSMAWVNANSASVGVLSPITRSPVVGARAVGINQLYRIWNVRRLHQPLDAQIAGNTAAVVTAADTMVATSDFAGRSVLAFVRSSADSPTTLSEVAARLIAVGRTGADTLVALADAAVRSAMALVRSASDTSVATSDTATRKTTVARTGSDTMVALTEIGARIVSMGRAAADTTVSIGDAALRQAMSLVRTASDTTVGIADAAVRQAMALVRSASDTMVALSDVVVRQATARVRAAADTLVAVSDTASRSAMALVRAAADTRAAITDAASRAAMAFVRTAGDTLGLIAETAAATTGGAAHLVRTAADTTQTIADSAVRQAMTFLRAAADTTTSLTEAATRTTGRSRVVADATAGVTEVATRAVQLGRGAADTVTSVADIAARLPQQLIRTAADAMAAIADAAINTVPVVIQYVAVTAYTRSMVAVTRTRDMAVTASTRSLRALAWTRDMAVKIITRSGKTSTR